MRYYLQVDSYHKSLAQVNNEFLSITEGIIMTKWEKFNIVQGFLNALNDEYRLHWHHSIDVTFDSMLKGKYGRVLQDKNGYCILLNADLSNQNAYFFSVSPTFEEKLPEFLRRQA